jgi:hypothetical protein
MSLQCQAGIRSTILATLMILFLAETILFAQEYWQSTKGPCGGPVDCVNYNSSGQMPLIK